VAFAVEGDGVGFATESYAASALYTTLASLSGALWRIRRAKLLENRFSDCSPEVIRRISGSVARITLRLDQERLENSKLLKLAARD
jgi:hypothetical protein